MNKKKRKRKAVNIMCTNIEAVDYNIYEGVAIVTGGSQGIIGPILVETLDDHGYKVFTPGLPEYDFSDPAQIRKMCEDLPVPNILVHNAAIDPKPDAGGGLSIWTGGGEAMLVNYYAPKLITELYWEKMKDLPDVKHIVFIGSIMGNIGADFRNYPVGFDKPMDYGASKRACMALVQNLAIRGAPHNILVNQLSFSAVKSEKMKPDFVKKFLRQLPLGRLLTPEDVRVAFMGLMIQTAMTGQQMLVDGGYTAW